jgi:hypothetical protein
MELRYNEIIEDTPVTVTPAVAATAQRILGETYPYKYVLGYEIRIRSMGTATYVGFGDERAQDVRLLVADQRLKYQCNRYEVIDLTKKFIISDTADAVIEVMCTFLPMKLYGSVRRIT